MSHVNNYYFIDNYIWAPRISLGWYFSRLVAAATSERPLAARRTSTAKNTMAYFAAMLCSGQAASVPTPGETTEQPGTSTRPMEEGGSCCSGLAPTRAPKPKPKGSQKRAWGPIVGQQKQSSAGPLRMVPPTLAELIQMQHT